MRKILMFLATEGASLYEHHGCRLIDSEYVPTFGGTGSVTLSNDIIELRIWLDRDRMFVDLRESGSKSPNSWVSIDILTQLITGEVPDEAPTVENSMGFLSRNFAELEDRFSGANAVATQSTCKKLKSQRAKRMFG